MVDPTENERMGECMNEKQIKSINHSIIRFFYRQLSSVGRAAHS
jgi:hypothetical protein